MMMIMMIIIFFYDGDGDGDTNDDVDIFLIPLKKKQHDCMFNCSMGPGYFDIFLKPYIFSHCYLKKPYRHSDKTIKSMEVATAAHTRVSKHPQFGFQLERNFLPSKKELQQ